MLLLPVHLVFSVVLVSVSSLSCVVRTSLLSLIKPLRLRVLLFLSRHLQSRSFLLILVLSLSELPVRPYDPSVTSHTSLSSSTNPKTKSLESKDNRILFDFVFLPPSFLWILRQIFSHSPSLPLPPSGLSFSKSDLPSLLRSFFHVYSVNIV